MKKLIESNDYIDSSASLTGAKRARKIAYDVYAALKAFGMTRVDYLDYAYNAYDDVNNIVANSDITPMEDYNTTADELNWVADLIEDAGDYGEEAEALRYAADCLTGKISESKKASKSIKKNIKENAFSDVLIDAADELRGIADYMRDPERTDKWFGTAPGSLYDAADEIESGDPDRGWTIADEVANEIIDDDEATADAIWDAIAPLRQVNESKKRKVIGKVSMREAKRALKESDEDENADLCLHALKNYLDYHSFDSEVKGDVIEYDEDWEGIRDLAFDVAKEFNDVCKPFFGEYYESGHKHPYYVGFQAYHRSWEDEE